MKRKVFIISLLISCCSTVQLSAQQTEKLSLYVFLSPECPLCRNYTTTLNKLFLEYSASVNFTGVIPGKTYSFKEIKRFAKEYHVNFNLVPDRSKVLTYKLGATITPEVVLKDSKDNIVYRGAIDDWAISLGKNKISPTISYLKNAIDQRLNGAEVIVKSIQPIGCLINDY